MVIISLPYGRGKEVKERERVLDYESLQSTLKK
jgi:hypothetical protein